MDIVYLVKNSRNNEELIYSLRTIKNIPHDKVFIVGGCPDEVNKKRVIHISVTQTGNKYQNTSRNLELICKDSRLSEEFILMNDDFFILKQINDPEKELNLCRGTIENVIEEYKSFYGNEENIYLIGMRQTKIFIEDMGINDPLSYELHIPIIMSKKGVLSAFSLPHINTIQAGHIRTIYGNLNKKDSIVTTDVKVRGLSDNTIYNDKFLSTSDHTWNYVKPYIRELFPNKGEYEL